MFTRITAAQEADWRHRNPRRVGTHPQRLSSYQRSIDYANDEGKHFYRPLKKHKLGHFHWIINRDKSLKTWNWSKRLANRMKKGFSVNVRLFGGHLTVLGLWFNNQNIPAAGRPESNEIGSMPLVKLLTSDWKEENKFLLVVSMAEEGGGWTKRISKKQIEPKRRFTQMRKQQQNIASFFDPIHQTADVQRFVYVKFSMFEVLTYLATKSHT